MPLPAGKLGWITDYGDAYLTPKHILAPSPRHSALAPTGAGWVARWGPAPRRGNQSGHGKLSRNPPHCKIVRLFLARYVWIVWRNCLGGRRTTSIDENQKFC
jgi:hypothetical protein